MDFHIEMFDISNSEITLVVNVVLLKIYCYACSSLGNSFHLCHLWGPDFVHPVLQRCIQHINKIYGDKPSGDIWELKLRPLPPTFKNDHKTKQSSTSIVKPARKFSSIQHTLLLESYPTEDEIEYNFARYLLTQHNVNGVFQDTITIA